MSASNSGDSKYTTRVEPEDEMEAFDRLPALIRKALNYNPLTMSAPCALELYHDGHSVKEIVAMIRDDQMYYMTEDRHPDWPKPDDTAFIPLAKRAKKTVNAKQ